MIIRQIADSEKKIFFRINGLASLLTFRLVFPKSSRCFATLAIAENKKNFFTCFAYFYVFPYFRFFKLLPLLGLLAPDPCQRD